MSGRICVVIYCDDEVRDTKNNVVFLSKNTTRLVFNQNIELTKLRKRIRCKIFGMTQIRVLSIKYRFCTLADPVTYDSFDIKCARGLEVMVQTHLASGSPYLELYVEFLRPDEGLATSASTTIREEYMTHARHSISGRQNTEPTIFSGRTKYMTHA
ncbi:hypothetical protein J1N35_037394 [Gossypium stocksii]|uniref:Uncharacterized protein n=1 Tax=Gossypium stocksii TaxID=47602 RepID=A0A9D3ZLU1_9ROSI|nr:hypothetical protein J1N35_037394 [Gossypium stocksii]